MKAQIAMHMVPTTVPSHRAAPFWVAISIVPNDIQSTSTKAGALLHRLFFGTANPKPVAKTCTSDPVVLAELVLFFTKHDAHHVMPTFRMEAFSR